ncbi:MAG: ankyrin repeat domain-containing protein [Alphaproteobacteria bacterium]|nr:ankyrin repeat domain-containing protein [Alphaproteobacteria bacterium]
MDGKDDEGTTALGRAAAEGAEASVRALLDAGADVNAVDSVYGASALLAAAVEGRGTIVRTLIAAGADVGLKAKGDGKGEGAGWTALMAAAMGGHLEIVSELLAAGADPRAVNEAGKTAADIARKERHGAYKEVIAKLKAAASGAAPAPKPKPKPTPTPTPRQDRPTVGGVLSETLKELPALPDKPQFD